MHACIAKVLVTFKLACMYIIQIRECVYKYSTTQYNYGEKEREVLTFSTDATWHCESSKDDS